MVDRHNDPADRRVVLVDYVAGMREVAGRIVRDRSRPLHNAMSKMTDGEALAFVKGLRLLAQSFGAAAGEEI
jgi:DNA-binding MarR family transcriptional regulator